MRVWGRGNFINLVTRADEKAVYAALSITREKRALESGVNLGAYFTATLKGLTGLGGLKSCRSSRVVCDAYPRRSSTSGHRVPPPTAEPEPFDPESLKRRWRLRYSAGGLPALLSLMQRCVPESMDIQKTWMGVKAELRGIRESVIVDRFLDATVVRTRHMASGV